jgi:hypothetical protein
VVAEFYPLPADNRTSQESVIKLFTAHYRRPRSNLSSVSPVRTSVLPPTPIFKILQLILWLTANKLKINMLYAKPALVGSPKMLKARHFSPSASQNGSVFEENYVFSSVSTVVESAGSRCRLGKT